jgi:two-component system, chemotaxis family, response regulator Rcp1
MSSFLANEGASNRPVGRPMEILLVEDSLVDARLTMGALKRGEIPHRMTLVRDGLEAIDFLLQRGIFARAPRPDLVLLDLELPFRSGLEVLWEIRNRDELRPLPVVVLTSSDDPDSRAQCEHHEVDGFLPKPVHISEFLDLVRKLRRHWKQDVLLPGID